MRKRSCLLLLPLASLFPLFLHAQDEVDPPADSLTRRAHTVTREQMNKGLVTDGLEALSGQAAGVAVVSGPEKGAMLSAVRVRGTTSLTGGNDPLVVIDGVISELSTLVMLYPGDIESFTVLKDASETAQYGSRGASGVIVVTTRKGQGGDFRISYDGTGAAETVGKTLQMLSAQEFRNWNNAHGYAWHDGGANTDWTRVPLRTGWVQKHHLAFGGGVSGSNYRASLGVMDRGSVLRTNRYQNYTAKVDLSQSAFNGIAKFDLGMYGSLQNNAEFHDLQQLFYSASAFNPTVPSGKVNGDYPGLPSSSQISNPSALLDKSNNNSTAHFNVHLLAQFFPCKWLTIKAFGSYSYSTGDESHFFPTYTYSGGEAYRGRVRSRDLLGNLSVEYHRQFGIHGLKISATAEAQKAFLDGSRVTTTGFDSNELGYSAIQAGAVRPWEGTSSWEQDAGQLSLRLGAHWDIASRYSISAGLSADASSLFGANHRWGFFPSVSGSWTASQEAFLKDVSWLSLLRLNVGYGQSGNQGALGAYYSRSLLSPVQVVSYAGASAVSFGLLRNANPDLRWEVRSSVNAGLETSFLKNRLFFSIEYYYSLTNDMLYEYEVSVPPFAYNRLMANLGKMSNSGLEIGLGAVPLKTKDWELNIGVNLTFQQNKLISLSGWYQGEYLTAPDIAGINAMNGAGFHGGHNDVVYQIVGQPLGVFNLPHCTGLVRDAEGNAHYEIADLNGDGVIDDGSDRYIAGQAMPKALLGSNISLRYKNFDLSVQINGAFGHKIYNGTALTYMNVESLPYYNVLSKAPAQKICDNLVTDYWLEKGDYVNIDYITLGYNIPMEKVAFIRRLRLSASVNNVATITGYSGLTPMINSSVVNSTFGLDDKISFPVYRTWSFSLSIQF